jgi:hypothetical protein
MRNGLLRVGMTAGMCLGIAALAGCRHAYFSGSVVVPVYAPPPPPPPPDGEVVVTVGPPEPIYENPGPPPVYGEVWVGGFYDYYGGGYHWRGGHWDHPPRPGARFVPDHFERRGDGRYVKVKGGWR